MTATVDAQDLERYRDHYHPAALARLIHNQEGATMRKDWPHMEYWSWAFREMVLGVVARKRGLDPSGYRTRQIWNGPPQHGKSTAASIDGPTWALDWFPWLKIMVVSYGFERAMENTREIRNNFRNHPRLLRTSLAPDSERKDRFHTPEGGMIMAAGVDSGVTGFPADIIVLDDLLKGYLEAHSKHMRDRAWNVYRADLLGRVPGGAGWIVPQTRHHRDDPCGRFIAHQGVTHKGDGKWWHINFQAIYNPKTNPLPDPIGRKAGEVLCPDRLTLGEMRERQVEVGPYMWESLYQQNPTSPDKQTVDREWWILSPRAPDHHARVLTFTTWDLNLSGTGKSYSVGLLITVTRRKDHYVFHVLDAVAKRSGYTDVKSVFTSFLEAHPDATHHLVEKAAAGHIIMDEFGRDDLDESEKLPGLVGLTPVGEKYLRLIAVSPLIKAGRVTVPEWAITKSVDQPLGEGWPLDLIEQCAELTKQSSTKDGESEVIDATEVEERDGRETSALGDDLADALSQGLAWARNFLGKPVKETRDGEDTSDYEIESGRSR